MGRDSMAVVDAKLKVYGIQNLRIADGSIVPRVTTGNTMAPTSSSVNVPEKSFGVTTRFEWFRSFSSRKRDVFW